MPIALTTVESNNPSTTMTVAPRWNTLKDGEPRTRMSLSRQHNGIKLFKCVSARHTDAIQTAIKTLKLRIPATVRVKAQAQNYLYAYIFCIDAWYRRRSIYGKKENWKQSKDSHSLYIPNRQTGADIHPHNIE